jgi:ferritin-like metal-binding protein YciE
MATIQKKPAPPKKRASSAKKRRGNSAAYELGKGVKATLVAVGRMLGGPIHVNFESLADLFRKELEDLYSAEQQLLDALPKMAEAAHSKALKTAFRAHLKETERHVDRLDKVFTELAIKPSRKTCHAMEGLIREGDEWISEAAEPGVKDAGLIAAAQRVEHYEMAGYGCVRTYARLLGHRSAGAILQQTLDEEGAADKKLTQLAKRINVQARPSD